MKKILILVALLVLAPVSLPAQGSGQQIVLQPATVAGIVATTLTRQITQAGSNDQQGLDVVINITATGTATGTLQLFVQDSVDGGVTWDDMISSNTFTFGAAVTTQRFYVAGTALPQVVTGAAATNITQGTAVLNETLTAGSARQGPFGERFRVREKVTAPSGSPVGPTYSILAVMR